MLPALREELILHAAACDLGGAPLWRIEDPLRHRFFEIDWLSFEVLKRWHLRDPAKICAEINQQTTLEVEPDLLSSVVQFLDLNELLVRSNPTLTDTLIKRAAARPGWIARLIRSYLYLRIPLLNPQPLLTLLAPLANLLGSRLFFYLTLIATLLGVIGLSRRWETYTAGIYQQLSLTNLMAILLVILGVKVLHELGHALTARRFNCAVPTMGVVLILGLPLLYTDVTSSWRLADPQRRIAIALAGIKVELYIAAWATLLWCITPAGDLRDALFLISSVTIIGSLIINASPFMRFDGYFALMDYWGISNLHQRAGELGRWKLRRLLLGTDEDMPEFYAAPLRRQLISFAYLTWTYRVLVFSSIAWLLYSSLPHPFGILLGGFEIYWLLLRPVLSELRSYKGWIPQVWQRANLWISLLGLIALFLLLALPWSGNHAIDAVIKPQLSRQITTAAAARIEQVISSEAQVVRAGELLYLLSSPELNDQVARLEAEIEQLRWTLANSGFSEDLKLAKAQTQKQLQARQVALQNARRSQQQLHILAPIAGWFEPAERWQPGVWIDQETLLGVVNGGTLVVTAMLDRTSRDQIAQLQPIEFSSELLSVPLTGLTLNTIDSSAAKQINEVLLTSVTGGSLRVSEQQEQWLPEAEVYPVEFRVADPSLDYTLPRHRGTLEYRLPPQSLMHRAWTRFRAWIAEDFGF